MKEVRCDLTVVGAGYAGICTAIAAARHGMKVALINDRNVPGGNASGEHRVSIGGATSGNQSYYAREAGIADEMKLTIVRCNPKHVHKQDFHLSEMAMYQMISNEENILYYPGTCVYDCDCENGQITAAYAFKASSQQQFRFVSPLFCDASGDGILGIKAGAEHRIGREAASEFNESLAPETADSGVMGSCILFTTKKEEQSAPFRKPAFAYDFVKDGIISFFDRPETERELPPNGGPYNGTWWIEYATPLDSVRDADAIDLELRKLMYSYWDFIKNSGRYPETENLSIDWIAPYASKRESYRFMGEHIMTQSDIQQSRDFTDAVSIGGWALDIHDIEGIYGKDRVSAFGPVKSIYNIPFSIMYSRNVPNLMLAGRIVSCTHVAMGSLRVMQTLGAMGQAVGTAAALCKEHACLPGELKEKYITELQETLQRDGQYIIGRREDVGLAKMATVSVSGEKVFENTDAAYTVPLDKTIYHTFPLPGGVLTSFEISVKNDTDVPVELPYAIYGEDLLHNYCCGEKLMDGVITVPAHHDGYVTVSPSAQTADKKVFFVLEPHKGIHLYCSDTRITGAPTLALYIKDAPIYEEKVRRLTEQGALRVLCFRNVVGAEGMYAASSLLNGYSRPYGLPNCWISDGKENAWLELCFDEPQTIRQIQLYFNPEFETDQFHGPIPQLVKDYDLHIYTENGEKTVEVRDNYLGRSCVSVSETGVNKIRVELLANNGAPEFEVFAVKVF